MGLWKKTLLYLGLVEDGELDDEEVVGYEEPPPDSPPTIRKISREELPAVQAVPPQPLGQVHFIEPRAREDAKEIGDKVKSHIPVILNLQGVEDDLFKWIHTFAWGLAYGLDGHVQKLAPRVYLITPANVEVSAEDRRRLMLRGSFDEM